jgi:hypothetical protein
MISKPPQNWSDESRAVTAAQSAVAVAQYATGATKRGYSLLKGIFLGFFALLWGFAGLAQFTIGGLGSASAAGGGIMIMLLAAIPGYFAWRNLKKAVGSDAGPQPPALPSNMDTGWRQENAFNPEARAPFGFEGNDTGSHQFAPAPPRFNTPRGGERREVPNRQAQLIKGFLFGIALIPLGYYVVQAGNPIIRLVGVFILFCGPIIVLKTLRCIIGAGPAFSYDGEGITVPGWFGEKHLAWRDISDFSIRTVTTYAYGIIKTSSQYSLYALKTGGGKKLLPTQFTGLDAEGLSELAAQLELYRSGMAGLGSRFSQDHSSAAPTPSQDFGQVGSGQVGFGRIDTGLAPSVPFASRPGPAAAPSFGRRQSAFGDR